jgi:uncharacterized membrane protein
MPRAPGLPYLREVVYLLLLVALSVGLVMLRIQVSGSFQYLFLGWSLLLAFVPLGVSLLHAVTRSCYPGWGWLVVCFVPWILFFPNAPYVSTDLIHVSQSSPMPRWYDPLMILTYAL